MSDSLSLFRLQRLDSQIDQIQKRLVQIKRILKDDRRIIQAQKNIERAKGEEKKIRQQLRSIEDRVESQRQKRSLGQAALFSGKIKNPKELQDLEMEAEALTRTIAQLEDQQLDIMLAHEDAEKSLHTAERAFKKLESTLLQENSLLKGEWSNLVDKLEQFKKEKEAVDHAVSASSRLHYEDLRKKKNGIAVTTVIDGSCSICGQTITQADQQRIKTSSSLVYCPSCGRILFIE